MTAALVWIVICAIAFAAGFYLSAWRSAKRAERAGIPLRFWCNRCEMSFPIHVYEEHLAMHVASDLKGEINGKRDG